MQLFNRKSSEEDRFDEYSNLSLTQTDQAQRVPGIYGPPLHVEQEIDAFGREQIPLWTAEGIVAAREAYVEKERLEAQHWSASHITDRDMDLVDITRRAARHAHAALGPFARRKGDQKIWFMARTGLLFVGDVVGQAGAQIYVGEVPELALIQSLAAGAAVVTAGLVGSEVKDLRNSAKRKLPEDRLNKAQRKLPHMFNGEEQGKHIVKAMIYTAGAVGCLVSGGIVGLRSFVDSPVAGLIYGCIASGVAVASFISSYVYSDDAADAIDNADRAYDKAVKRQLGFSAIEVRSRAAKAGALYTSIKDEHTFRGEAAQIAHEGLKHRVLRRNPGVTGHSPAEHPEPVIGSKPRPSEEDS